MSETNRLQREFDHLEKTHKAGIINEKEFNDAKKRIEKKLQQYKIEETQKKEKNNAISEILENSELNKKKKKIIDEKTIKEADVKTIKEVDVKTIKEVDNVINKENKNNLKTKHNNNKIIKIKKFKQKNNYKTDFEDNKRILYVTIFLIFIISTSLFLLLKNNSSNNIIVPKDLSAINKTIDIVYYGSFNCEPCHETFLNLQKLKIIYGTSINVVYKNFPIDLEEELFKGKISICTNNYDNQIEIYKILFIENSETEILKQIENTGIEMIEFNNCINTRETLINITDQYKEGLVKEIDSLPLLTVDGDQIIGSKSLGIYELIIDTNLELI